MIWLREYFDDSHRENIKVTMCGNCKVKFRFYNRLSRVCEACGEELPNIFDIIDSTENKIKFHLKGN